MKPYPFTVTNSNFAALEAKVWPKRRMQTLDDEVGRNQPGKFAAPVSTKTPAEREFAEPHVEPVLNVFQALALYLLAVALVAGLAYFAKGMA